MFSEINHFISETKEKAKQIEMLIINQQDKFIIVTYNLLHLSLTDKLCHP